jgi:exonuclease SbcC
MRPLGLELEGFATFRERIAVDFAGAELFAIVGATGHGKSSLIDAIVFALYGRVPRHGGGDLAPVMTLGCNETRVSFTFELAGTSYVATRVVRRKPSGDGATTREMRLERIGADGSTEVVAGRKDEFDAEVQRLVGLDFEQFTKCVVLPQGEFASFLHARAGDRVAILSALLDLGRYDRVAATARDRAREAAGVGAAFAAQRAGLTGATLENRDKAHASVEALAVLRAEVDAAAPRDAALAEEIVAAGAEAEAAARAADALAAVRVPSELRSVVEQIDAARTEAERAAVEVDAAEGRTITAEEACDAHPPLDELRDAAAAHIERASLLERIEKGTSLRAEQTAEAEEAQAQLVKARALAAETRAALEDAQHRHAHAELRAGLRVGEPCPVCEHEVERLPAKLRAAELTAARKQHTAAEKERGRIEERAQSFRTALAQTTARLEELQAAAEGLLARVAVHPDAKALTATLTAVAELHERAAQARKAAQTARGAAKRANDGLKAFDAELAAAEAAMQQQRDAVVAAGLEPPRPARKGGLAATWDALATWADEHRPDHEKRAAELEDVARTKNAERHAVLGDLAKRAAASGARELDIGATLSVADLVLALAGAQHDAAEALRTVEEQLAHAADIDARIAAARADEQVASELGRLLDRGHFTQWLVDEALRGLVAGASVLLDRLSNGQYALTIAHDGDLLVVDRVNADETRSVRSLSGGETFQASLALALALADQVAELAADGAARLESIFLDEGFGTLDPDTLDVVAGTIESLGGGERVVGIVTHVPALAERMPVRFRVRKIERTATVTREDA